MDAAALFEQARRASELAYAPYSGFRVGAAVLGRDGRVVSGANVENASYGLTLCAERAALARAVAEGLRPGDIEAVAVTASPCGGCRQWLLEFAVGHVVFPVDAELVVRTPAELLPESFEFRAVPGRAWGGVAGEGGAAPGRAWGGVVGEE
jgi:cytidine deaminase